MIKKSLPLFLALSSAFNLSVAAWAQEAAPAVSPEQATLPEEKVSAPEAPGEKKVERIPGVELGEKAEGTGKYIKPDEDYGKVRGILGPVTLGLGLSVVGLLRPVEFSLQGKLKDYVGFQGTYGFLPKLTIAGYKVSVNATDARLRWHPFRGSFYLGASIGTQNVIVAKSQTISGFAINAEGEVKTSFVTPMIGWRWVWNSGFFMGMDLGWQIARSSQTKVTLKDAPAALTSTDEYKKAENEIVTQGNKYGKTNLPHLSLLSFGWLF